jgi:hypothetical protein
VVNFYEAILQAAQMRRQRRAIENQVGRAHRREAFLRSVPHEPGDTDMHDLVDFQSDSVR